MRGITLVQVSAGFTYLVLIAAVCKGQDRGGGTVTQEANLKAQI
jgi:hypothetical protein